MCHSCEKSDCDAKRHVFSTAVEWRFNRIRLVLIKTVV